MPNEEIKFKITKASEETKEEIKEKIQEEAKKPKQFKIHFEEKHKKNFIFIYILIFVIILGGGFYYFFIFKNKNIEKISTPQVTLKEETPIINPFAKKIIETSTKITTTAETSSIITTSTAALSATETTSSITTTQLEIFTEKETTTVEEKITTKTDTIKLSTPTKPTETIFEPSAPKEEEIKVYEKEILPQGTTTYWGLNFNKININLDTLNKSGFENKWIELLKIQKEAGSIYQVDFLFNKKRLGGDFIKDYFLNPSFIESKYIENFKNGLTEDYIILFYYSYTRKFPIIIFDIKDDFIVATFMRLWDKETILKDFNNLYKGLPKGRLLRNYTITENYNGVDYKIAYFDNDYKFIWTIYNNKLIVSTTLTGFKVIINKIK